MHPVPRGSSPVVRTLLPRGSSGTRVSVRVDLTEYPSINNLHIRSDFADAYPGLEYKTAPGAVERWFHNIASSINGFTDCTWPDHLRHGVIVTLHSDAETPFTPELSALGLPVCVAYMMASGALPPSSGREAYFIGNVDDGGNVFAAPAIHPCLDALSDRTLRGDARPRVFLPVTQLHLAPHYPHIHFVGVGHLRELPRLAVSVRSTDMDGDDVENVRPERRIRWCADDAPRDDDGALRRALMIAVAGRHNIYVFVPEGEKPRRLASAMVECIPDLSAEASSARTRVLSQDGLLPVGRAWTASPQMAAPHYTATPATLLGRPERCLNGDLARATGGVVLIENPWSHSSATLDALSAVQEQGWVDTGMGTSVPADFVVIAVDDLTRPYAGPALLRPSLVARTDLVHVVTKTDPLSVAFKEAEVRLVDAARALLASTPTSTYDQDALQALEGESPERALRLRRVSRTVAALEGQTRVTLEHMRVANAHALPEISSPKEAQHA